MTKKNKKVKSTLFKHKLFKPLLALTLVLVLIIGAGFYIFRSTDEEKKQSFASFNGFEETVDPVLGTINLQTVTINASQTQNLRLYFPYGPVRADTEVLNANSNAVIQGSGVTFDPSTFVDRYYGNPAAGDDGDQPQQIECFGYFNQTDSYNGPSYQINSSLATATGFDYGLQSARNAGSPSGAATVNRLEYGHTGCLAITVNFTPQPEGTVTQVVFDEDVDDSPSYPAGEEPYPVVYRFVFSNAASSSSTVVSSSALSSLSSSSLVTSSAVNSSSSLVSSISSSQVSSSNNNSSQTNSSSSIVIISSSSSVSNQSSSLMQMSSSIPNTSSSQVSSTTNSSQANSSSFNQSSIAEVNLSSNSNQSSVANNSLSSQNNSSVNNSNSSGAVISRSSSSSRDFDPNTFTGNTVRSGGAQILTILALTAAGIVGYIAYKANRKKMNKADIISGSSKKKDKK